MTSRRIQFPLDHLAIAAAILALTLLLVHYDWLQRWDNLVYDAQLHFLSRPPPDDVVIVAIDDASLEALGRWPWPRDIHATLVDHLSQAGAKAILLDILFSEQTVDDPQQDKRLVDAVAASGRVFLPVVIEERTLGGQLVESLPFSELAVVAKGLGHVHMELEGDGFARGVYLREGIGSPYWEQLTVSLLRGLSHPSVEQLPGQRNPDPVTPAPFNVMRDHYALIPFSGPPGHFQRLSYAQVIDGHYRPEDIRDKIILVGATATGMGDVLPTPLSARHQPMSGVEINAQLLDGLRRGLTITRMEPQWRLLWSGLLVLIPFLLFPRLSPRAVLATTAILLFGLVLLSTLVLVLQQLWFPPAPALLGLLLSYPLWSWRRLENTMGYLDGELERLQSEPRLVEVFEPAPDLVQGVTFLSQLLPIDGWLIQDEKGVCLHQQGVVPVVSAHLPSAAGWVQEGRSMWASIPTSATPARLALQWGREAGPTAQQRGVLDNFISQLNASFAPSADSARTTVELIETRIQQVQSASNQLRTIRRLVSDTLGQMDEGLLVISSTGRVVMANPRAAEFLTLNKGANLHDRPLLPLLESLHIDTGSSWLAALRDVLVDGRSVQLEASQPAGLTLYLQLAPLMLHDQAGRGIIINLSDVTLLKRSERQRSQALGFLSHDLRSPITSLLALLQSGDQTMDRERIDEIESYARKTLKLADDFLHLARAENADTTHFSEVDLISVAHNAADELYSRAHARAITIERAGADTLLTECIAIASELRKKLTEWEDTRPLTEHEKSMIDRAWEKHKAATPRFNETFCSQCGGAFGPGNHGYSHCDSHKGERCLSR